jgi:hypothetical protein
MAASAQAVRVEVTVPFSFMVNRAAMPAGQYSVWSVDPDRNTLAIRNLNSHATRLVLSNACTSARGANATKLVFHRYGTHYFLSQIWREGAYSGREIPQSALEKELAKDTALQQVVFVAAR